MEVVYKYRFELILLLFQITPLSGVATIIGSIYIFSHIVFSKWIDIYKLFLLLIPSIILVQGDEFSILKSTYYNEMNWLRILIPNLSSVVLVGALAISPHFFAALALPFRLIRKVTNRFYFVLWLTVLVISIYGLNLSITEGVESAGGLTVGLRMALIIGVLILPLSVDRKRFNTQLTLVVKTSIILMFLGLSNSHWQFVSASFPVLLLMSKDVSRGWKIFSIINVLLLLMLGYTFTIKLTVIFSFILALIYFSNKFQTNTKSFKLYSILMIFLFPIYTMFLTISQQLLPIARAMGSDRFVSKLFEDRGEIWLFTLEMVRNSPFFAVKAGRPVPVVNYSILGKSDWEAGSHNIFLEASRQLGMFSTLIISILLLHLFLKLRRWNFQKQNNDTLYLTSLLAVYMVFGLTGNSLIYDGVGFLFWIILSQLIIINTAKT